MRRILRLFRHDERGAAAAEMALILPAALALLFTTFEGAWYIVNEHQMVKGVRDAARYAGRLDFSYYDCGSNSFVEHTITQDMIRNLARTGKLTGGTSVVTGWTNGQVQISVSCASAMGGLYASNGNLAPKVKVYSTTNYPSLMGQMGFASTVQIKAAAESPVMGL